MRSRFFYNKEKLSGILYRTCKTGRIFYTKYESQKGYNAFALIYRPGADTACEDLARAIAFIHEHAEGGLDCAVDFWERNRKWIRYKN